MSESAKKSAQQILDRLPDDADWGRIMYELYVRQKIERSLADVAEGRIVTHDEMRRAIYNSID